MRCSLELLHDRYARALFDCAEQDGIESRVMGEIEMLSAEWLVDKKFDEFLIHPLIEPSEKKGVIEELAKREKLHRTTLDFLKVLIDNKRENLLHAVFLRYKDLYNKLKKRITVQIETARHFTEKEKKHIVATLKRKFRKDIDLEIRENPSLISGVSLQCGDRIYDYSVKNQLERLKDDLLK